MFCAPPKALRNLLPLADQVLARGRALSRLLAAVPTPSRHRRSAPRFLCMVSGILCGWLTRVTEWHMVRRSQWLCVGVCVSASWYLVFCVGGSPGGSSSGTLQGDRRPTLQQSRILREGAFRHTRGMCVS